MRGKIALVVVVALTLLPSGVPAAAATTRPTLPASASSAHFLIHYDPATASSGYVGSALADFEESYSRMIVGGGGTPNAGLLAPVNDSPRGGDARTDVYLTAPPNGGGQMRSDNVSYPDPLIDSGFILMDPSMPRQSFRFRAAHEFMHVVQLAYIETMGLLSEGTANWASDLALPDVDPLDSQFAAPFLPLDCSYGSWNGQPCGNGYAQWLFFRWLSEHFGDGFVHRLWQVHATSFKVRPTTAEIDRDILAKAISDEPGDAKLASMYADYAAALWDPAVWTTTAVQSIYRAFGSPSASEVPMSASEPSTGSRSVLVDHLATKYIRFVPGSGSAVGDRVRVRVTPGVGAFPPRLLSSAGPTSARSVVQLSPTGDGAYEAIVPLAFGDVADVVLPLTNTTTTDALEFTYSAELLSAPVEIEPKVFGLAISPKRFTPMSKGPAVTSARKGTGGARLTFAVTVAATMKLTIERRTDGRLVRGTCVKPTRETRKKKECMRYRKVTTVTVPGIDTGMSVLRLTGRRSSAKVLPVGGYRLVVSAIDTKGVGSNKVTATFGIKKLAKR